MTEQQWLKCTDPPLMLKAMADRAKQDTQAQPPSQRKLRLFAVACCRRISHLFPDDRCRRAVEVAEREADGQATPAESDTARHEAIEVICRFGVRADRASGDPYCDIGDYLSSLEGWRDRYQQLCQEEAEAAETVQLDHSHCESTRAAAAVAACDTLRLMHGYSSIGSCLGRAASAVHFSRLPPPECDPDDYEGDHYQKYVRDREELVAQRALVDCVFGNPFRPAAIDPAWQTTTVITLARQMYEARDFSAMPILADALQDAGCENADVLDHCRGGGPHTCGCWVLDLLLGKS
jgi:hypothetical protein